MKFVLAAVLLATTSAISMEKTDALANDQDLAEFTNADLPYAEDQELPEEEDHAPDGPLTDEEYAQAKAFLEWGRRRRGIGRALRSLCFWC